MYSNKLNKIESRINIHNNLVAKSKFLGINIDMIPNIYVLAIRIIKRL